MKTEDIQALARKAAKTIKTEKDLSDFSRMLKKITVETALNAEFDDHLGYDRHKESDNYNYRNGYSSKTLSTDDDRLRSRYCEIVKLLNPILFDAEWEHRHARDQFNFEV